MEKLPFIPLEAEIDSIISAVNLKTSVFMRIVKETWARAGEIWNLRWIDVDFNRGTVTITPEKGTRPRLKKLKPETIAGVLRLPRQVHVPQGQGESVRELRRLLPILRHPAD